MTDEKQSTRSRRAGMRELEIRTRRMVDDTMAGAYHSVFKGRGMDFDEVREYSPGDEVRTIDWNVTARAGRTFVKKFTEERELTIFLVVDISASGNFGSGELAKRDLAAEVASVLAFSAIRNSDKVGLILYTDRIERYLPPRKGRRHVLRVVRDILYHDPAGIGTDTVNTLDVVNKLLHRRAIVFLISDFAAAGDPESTRAQLRIEHEVRAHQARTVLSARIVAAAPLVALVGLRATNPRYLDIFNSVVGQAVLIGCAASVALGYAAMLYLTRLPGQRRVLVR